MVLTHPSTRSLRAPAQASEAGRSLTPPPHRQNGWWASVHEGGSPDAVAAFVQARLEGSIAAACCTAR